MDNSVKIHAPEEILQLPSKSASSHGSKRTKTATSSGSRATEVEKSATRPSRSCEPKSMASSISVVGRPASDGSERHRLWSGDRKRRHGADRRQDSPRHHIRDMTADEERLSGPIQALRVGPAPGDKWMRLVVQGPTAFPRRRTPVLRPLPLMLTIIASLQAIADPCNHRHLGHRPTESLRPVIIMREDERVLKGPDHRTSPDVKYSCLQNVAKSPERRTITVISSPAQPVQVEEPAVEVAGPAAVAGPSEVMEGPAVDSPASDDPAGNDLASDGPADGPAVDGSVGDGSARCDDPSRKQTSTDGSALQFDDPADSDSPARHQSVVLDGPAAHGTPAGTMPSGGQDASILTGVSSPLFPSIPTSINQAILIDFMSMWTLLQRWMDQGMAPDAQASPAAQSTVPVPRDDTTPRRSDTPSRTPERRPRTPVRWVRTPVRRVRGLDDTRESSRSRSPVSRSSSVESPARDASPVNFSAASDPDDKIKERSISDDEDEEADHKKISTGQYQLVRQAVTT